MELDRAKKLADIWVAGPNEFPEVRDHLKLAVAEIVATYMLDDYSAEKLIKSFCEPIYYLSTLFLERMGYPRCLTNPSLDPMLRLNIRSELDQVKQKLTVEINRQARHFNQFLSHAVTHRTKDVTPRS